jgi:hypothetical protein
LEGVLKNGRNDIRKLSKLEGSLVRHGGTLQILKDYGRLEFVSEYRVLLRKVVFVEISSDMGLWERRGRAEIKRAGT